MSDDAIPDSLSHKEKSIQADNADVESTWQKMKRILHIREPKLHHSPSTLFNVVTGEIAPDDVDVDTLVSIGQSQPRNWIIMACGIPCT